MSINERLVSSLLKLRAEATVDYVDAEHELVSRLNTSCAELRKHLLSEERDKEIVQLSEATSYWELTPKCRYDYLIFDIPSVANQLAFSVWLARLQVEHLTEATSGYFPTWSDALFWYHIDFGVRLTSSAWDRTALLLDLAFQLDSGAGCSLPTVLKCLPSVDVTIIHLSSFKMLKAFRDGPFKELEAGPGAGARHEATHLLSPSTRRLAECIESFSRKVATGRQPREWLDFLQQHHAMYLEGLEHALRLVEQRWPPT